MRNNGHVQLTGTSSVMIELKQEIERVARSDAKVLITGESGVGKELVAQRRPRAQPAAAAGVRRGQLRRPSRNAARIRAVRARERQLHRRVSRQAGQARDGRRGTIFLDEIGEMTLRMQGLLLRFMETGELQKVGADRAGGASNVRVIAATNRNLRDMIAQGTFREDLFYRLNVIHLTVPPLRERREDIPELIEHFLSGSSRSNGYVVKARGAGSVEDAHGLLVAGQRPRARERHRAIVVTGRTKSVPHRRPADGRAMHRRRAAARSANGAARWPTICSSGSWRIASRSGTSVYPLYMQREITRGNVRDVVRKGLEEARGNYKIVARMFNMEQRDYKRFLNFLRKHDCQLPFKEYR